MTAEVEPNMPVNVCPPESKLRALALGDPSLRQFDEISDHISRCEACEAHVERYERDAHALVEEFCACAAQNGYLHEAELQVALRAASAGRR